MSNDKKEKPDLLLLHGALGAKTQFEKLETILGESFNVYTMNFSGHGGSPIPKEPFSIELFAEDILKFLDSRGIGSINVFGYSMGGYAAIYLAKVHPDRIKKIFTLATKFEWTEEISAQEVLMLDAEKIKEKVPVFARELFIRHGFPGWKTVLVKTAEMMINLGKNNILKKDDFGEIAHEILVGIGDRDKMVTLEETISVYRKLRNGRLLVLPSTSHPLEQVDAGRLVSEMVSNFKK